MPRLVEAQDEFGPDGLVIVGVTEFDAETVESYTAEHGVTWPVLADAEELVKKLGVRLVWGSVIYLVDFEGQVLVEGLDDCLERLAVEVEAG